MKLSTRALIFAVLFSSIVVPLAANPDVFAGGGEAAAFMAGSSIGAVVGGFFGVCLVVFLGAAIGAGAGAATVALANR